MIGPAILTLSVQFDAFNLSAIRCFWQFWIIRQLIEHRSVRAWEDVQ